ncbi:hypothetical protein A176_003971 [Myxococcus hansupus]|uniref:Uncharacterized protein n=1 Tax=Pseudomyxococcus hansupus TaxID=1297742 RepID=A0A0H4WW75_9BACT|nr:hypothetical protein [Myxococcus hansupus]AKQ67059.1 hypothetical protein A176_003971 [Myxococcus hansupus]
MKKMLARIGLLGLVAGLAGMSYSMPAVAAPKAPVATQDARDVIIIITPDEVYLYIIDDGGVAATGTVAAAKALTDATFDN